jgi:hypothetical protein
MSYLGHLDKQQVLKEINEIRGDKSKISYGRISDVVRDHPGSYPYIQTHFFDKSNKEARSKMTRYLTKTCGWGKWNSEKKGNMATYIPPEELC